MAHAPSVGIAEPATAVEPTLLQIAGGLGGDALVARLRGSFGLDAFLQPRPVVNFLRYVNDTSTSRVADFPPDPALPRAVLTLADYARSVHTVRRFLTDYQEQFEIPALLERSGTTYMRDTGEVASAHYPSLERALIWDDASYRWGVSMMTWLRGLLYIALLSGERTVLQRRLEIAQELSTPGGGRLARLHAAVIEEHERHAAALLTHHLADPIETRDRLRDLLREIAENRLGTLSNWRDPIKNYAIYNSNRSPKPARTKNDVSKAPETPKKSPSSPPRPSIQQDRRYRSSRLTLDDLKSPQRSLATLYGSSGVHLDKDRLQVLSRLVGFFGKKRCSLAQGNFDGAGSLDVDTSAIDHTYVILVIDRHSNGKVRQDAIAISPMAGAHAAYYVRSDASEQSWQDVLATGKLHARAVGARRLPFRGGVDIDPYRSMDSRSRRWPDAKSNASETEGFPTTQRWACTRSVDEKHPGTS